MNPQKKIRKMKFEDKYINIKQLCSEELKEIEKIMIDALDLRQEFLPYVAGFLKAPSKRIRPVLSLLFLKAAGFGIDSEILKVLAAVELVHNASLIHDDIIDQSDIRRGVKTISSNFGNKLGVICGDYLLSEAMNILLESDSVEIIKQFINTLKKMCIGEVNQHFESFKIGTIEEYIEKSKNKTAYLFQTALSTPLKCCSASDSLIAEASDFGLNFGIAFQMRDDILNLVSDENLKPSKSDLQEGVYTAAVIYANDTENYSDGVEKARCLLNNYTMRAEKNLSSLEDNVYTLALRELLELLKYE